MKHKTLFWRGLVAAALSAMSFAAGAQPGPIQLRVDATDLGRRMLHAYLQIPVAPGPVTLVYPKWAPGEHMPNDLLNNLLGLKISAAGRTVEWKRDDVDMYQYHLIAPPGAYNLQVALDYLLVRPVGGFEAGPSATEKWLDLCWNQLLLYPLGAKAADLQFSASLRLPAGWKFGTALERTTKTPAPDEVEFAPVSLERLVDSPLIAGKYFREFDVSGGVKVPHFLDVVADSAAAAEVKPEFLERISRLAPETGALFGARHYRAYHFLATVSDHVGLYGLEHHESSDNREAEDYLTDDKAFRSDADLFAHEMTHSWNGKFRRPAGLATPDFQEPMKDELLWVYEGLTEYLGVVLAARAGIWTNDDARETIASFAAQMDNTQGRKWRPLADTAVCAQTLYSSPHAGESWRRSADYYPEGLLIWLEADTIIRQESHGARSLDDFCRAFHGGTGGAPEVFMYTLDDVVGDLNSVSPHDWRQFFQERVYDINPRAPLGGIERAGWRLDYTNESPELLTILTEGAKETDLRWSLGFAVNNDGNIIDVVPGSAADQAGLAPDLKLVAVDGRKWTADRLRAAVKSTATNSEPVTLLIEQDDFYKTLELNYHGGERYPCLMRDPSKPDLLADILRAHAKK